MENIYNIVMYTDIGEKKGTISININNNKIYGYINILGKKNILQGKKYKKGNCILYGTIETIVSTFRYNAKGYIDKDIIEIKLNINKDIFKIIGEKIK